MPEIGLAGVHEATKVLVTAGVHVVVTKVGLPVVPAEHEATAVGPVAALVQVMVT